MSTEFKIRKSDVGRSLVVAIRDSGNAFISLPGGCTAVFKMTSASGKVVTGAATIGDYGGGTRNQLTYAFQGSDTIDPGRYDAVFIVTGSGYVETFPTSSDSVLGLVVEVTP